MFSNLIAKFKSSANSFWQGIKEYFSILRDTLFGQPKNLVILIGLISVGILIPVVGQLILLASVWVAIWAFMYWLFVTFVFNPLEKMSVTEVGA